MTEADTGQRSARRAALFGAASGRHRAVQPIPRRQQGVTSIRRPDELATAAAVRAADPAVLLAGTTEQVEHQVLAILAASKQRTVTDLQTGDLARDGSLAIDSMSAVFVCRIVAQVLGPRDWTRLRGNCSATDFVSTRSVASLVSRLRRQAVAA
jgi:hypothetical protein